MKRITSLLVCFAMFGLSVLAQDIQITGKVTSADDGSILPGVSVVVKGTTVGTTTSVDGEYSISAPSEATLVFSFVGMRTQEIVVGGQTSIDASMEMDVTGLEEVVVTAFGISREKKAMTYQTESVTGEDLLAGQTTTAAQGLVGKVAGLQVNVQDNGVNPSSQILLRGLRSITRGNEALIVIDGAIATTGAFDDLNANDIESVNVLKGATAAALYGSNAVNGALIVTTKSGKLNNRFTAGYTNSTTFQKVAYMPDFQTEYGNGWDGVYNEIENTNWGPRFDGVERQIGPTFEDGSYQAVPYAPIADNLKDFYNTGSTVQNTFYVTGGDETGSYYMSIGNQNTKGVIPDDTYKRTTFKVNATKKLGKIELGVNTSYLSDERDVVGDNIGDQDRTFYWFILNTQSNIPLTSYSDWDNPDSYGYADNYYNAFYQNPYWAIGTNRDNNKSQRLIGNLSAAWDILDNLKLTGRAGVNTVSGIGKDWRALQEYDPILQPYHSTVTSYVLDDEYQSTRYTGDLLLQGDFNLTDDISLKAILGSSVYAMKYRDSEIQANNLSIPGFYDISNGTGIPQVGVDESAKRTVGFFGDFTVGYKKMVFLNLTGRQDYTSTLAEGNNGYFYPAIGLSFILTEAVPSIKGDILEFAKITINNSTVYNDLASYAINERFTQFASGSINDPGFPFPYGSQNGFYKSNTAVNSDIQKEKLVSNEFGLNLAFLQGRITLDAAYFMSTTTNLITYTTPSFASSATSYLTNIGELESKGYEATLGARVLQLGDFKWDINLNISSSETIVNEIQGDQKEVALDAYTGYGTYAVVGKAFPQIKAVGYVRDEQGRTVIDEASGNPLVGELEDFGSGIPDYTLAGSTQLGWKGITASATFDYRTGHIYYSQGNDAMEFTGRSMESVSADRQDFVWPNSVYQSGTNAVGDPVYTENTDIQITGGRMNFWKDHYNQINENYVKDATAFKLREVALNYTLPSSILSSTKVISKVTIGFVARNVLTILPKGQSVFSDPEFRNTRSTDDPNGIGIGGYINGPPTRSYGFSLNIEF